MAIKDLVVAYNGSDNSSAALQLAMQLATQHAAALTGLHIGTPPAFEGLVQRWIGPDVLASLEEAHRKAVHDLERQFMAEVAAGGFSGEIAWVTEDGQPNELLARFSRYFDILIIGQYSTEPERKRRVRAEDLVVMSGKPLLIVPNGYKVRPFSRYSVVAWDGGNRAARALTDAMQILEKHDRLDILTVAGDGARPPQHPALDLVRHLKRHGVDARQVVLPAERDGIAATILKFCAENNPDFLVMGAYGHPRLREDLLGGVTRQVLRNMTVPVFMAH